MDNMTISMDELIKFATDYVKACEALDRINRAMTEVHEDSHGNVSPYRWDKVHQEIFDALESVGYDKPTPKVKYFPNPVKQWVDVPEFVKNSGRFKYVGND